MNPDVELGTALGTDFLHLRDDIGDHELDYLERTRAFVQNEVQPVIADFWERAEFPWDLARRMGELGLVGDGIHGYGCPDMSPSAAGIIAMELSRVDGSLATFAGVQAGLAMRSIASYGSEEHKQRWLGPLARVEKFGAFALTEPDHGSDSILLETSARIDGDEVVLNGRKRWIGNGTIADVIVVWARGEDDAVGGYLVEKGTPGLTARKIDGKGALRAVWQADIDLVDVRVPCVNRLPGAKRFKDVGRVLAGTRNHCAFSALGHAVGAFDIALSYTGQRIQFGKPLSAFQIVQDKLVKMLAEIVAMQLYCFRSAQLKEQDRLTDTISSLAKMNNTRKARQVILEARDLLGGNGILLENHVMRHLADIEAVHTYEGTETIQTLLVGRAITGHAAFV